QLTGRRFSRQRATLEGFARVVAAHGYPTIVPQAGARVEGVLVEDVDAASLAALDVYEDAGRLYARRPAEVLVDCRRGPAEGCAGGAQRTTAVMNASLSRSPSSRSRATGWLAKPARWSAA